MHLCRCTCTSMNTHIQACTYTHIDEHTCMSTCAYMNTREHTYTHHRKKQRGRNTFQVDKLKSNVKNDRRMRVLWTVNKLKGNASDRVEAKLRKLRRENRSLVNISHGHDLGWPWSTLHFLSASNAPLAGCYLNIVLEPEPDSWLSTVETKVWPGSCPFG